MFDISNWLEFRSKLKIEEFIIDDVKVELMNLTTDLFKDVVACGTSNEMLELAANSGISYNRNRVVDNDELSKDLDILWSLDNLQFDTEPSLRHKIGEKVCVMSGLSNQLEEKRELEALEAEENQIIDGDAVTQEQLAEDIAHHQQHVA